jgi:peptide/nickel transport system substrate-binding protein
MLKRCGVAAGALLAFLIACSPHPGNDRDARFIFPMPIEPATLNFVTGTDQASVLVERLLADSLIDHDAAMRVVPRLARSWEFSSDGRVLTFHLHPGVRFHDGQPLTSGDVAFTYERIVDPASKAVGRIDPFLPVEKVETPDPMTVRVTYREPYAPALRSWEVPILPAHRYRGVDFTAAPENRAPIGSGPFRFVAWEAGRRIVLQANLDYWGGRPALDGFVFQIIPSSETVVQALLAGEVDYARIGPAQWQSLSQDPAFQRRFRAVQYVPLFFNYIAWRGDGSNPYFADADVRRAMTLALDRDGYVRTVLHGVGKVIRSPFEDLLPPGGTTTTPPFDPGAAASLLDGAGWRLDPKTGLRARAGRPFRFTLLIFTGGADHVQFAQVAQEELRRLGIEMAIERLDWQTLWARLKSGDFQAAMSGTVPGADPDSMFGMLHSTQIDGGQNYAAYRDPEVDAWLAGARSTLDDTARVALYRRVEERLALRQPYTFLFAPGVQAAINARFEGAEASPQGILGYFPGAMAIRPAAGGR